MEENFKVFPCETCGEPIFNEEDDFNGMCEECYHIAPTDK